MQKTSEKSNREEDNIKQEDLLSSPSAFQLIGNKDIRRPSLTSKRDSGYVTDNSPANFGHQLVFSFEESFCDLEESVKVEEDSDEIEDLSDQEVEMVLSQSPGEGPSSVSDSLLIPPRPQAPYPGADDSLDLLNDVNNQTDNEDEVFEPVSATRHLTTFSCDHRTRRRGLCYFRPINSRAIGTQTPNPHSQMLQEAMDRFHPYPHPIHVARTSARIRHFSEGEENPSSHLPDIVPATHRDRSVSLPDVPLLRQQRELEVGRELRRISDEFHLSYALSTSRRRSEVVAPGSFPGTSRFSFADMWTSLRQVFSTSSSPIVLRDPDEDEFPDVEGGSRKF